MTAVWYVEIWGCLVEKWWYRKFSALLSSHFWKLIHKESWLEIFWENEFLLTWILYAKQIFLSPFYFLTFKNSVSAPFCNFEIRKFKVAIFYNFCKGELIIHLLDQEWFILPVFMQCFMRYSILSFNLSLWSCVKTWNLTSGQILHVCWERLVLVPAGHVMRASKRHVTILTLPEC